MAFGRPSPALLVSSIVFVSLAGCAQPLEQSDGSALGLLAGHEAVPSGKVREFDLYVRADNDYAVEGIRTFTYRFAFGPDDPGSIPAPEIRVTQGDTVRVRLHSGTHTIHWHGVRLPWGMDGVPDMTQTIGEGTFVYEFVAKDAGTFWYHCHVAAPEHIDIGLFGAFIVEPADPTEDLPFDREATLFLHEMDIGSYGLSDGSFTAMEGDPKPETLTNVPTNPFDLLAHAQENAAVAYDEQMEYTVGQPQDRGYLPQYDTFLINGKSYPNTDPVGIKEGETLRLRVIHAGQLTHTMHLHGHRFLVTHKDGAELASPYLADTIGLFPGERYDLYVLGDNPGHWDFHDHGGGWGIGTYASNRGTFPGGMTTVLQYEDWDMPTLLGPTLGAHAHS